MATNTQITINYNGGSPYFDPEPGKTSLRAGDSVTVVMENASSGASIDRVVIFANKVVDGQDQKDTSQPLCLWTRSSGNTCTMYDIASSSDLQVTITDIEHPTAPDIFWFSVAGPPVWSLDPELQNEPDSGP